MLRYFLICEYNGVQLNVHFIFPSFFFILFDFRIWYDILKRFDENMRFFICLFYLLYPFVELSELLVLVRKLQQMVNNKGLGSEL